MTDGYFDTIWNVRIPPETPKNLIRFSGPIQPPPTYLRCMQNCVLNGQRTSFIAILADIFGNTDKKYVIYVTLDGTLWLWMKNRMSAKPLFLLDDDIEYLGNDDDYVVFARLDVFNSGCAIRQMVVNNNLPVATDIKEFKLRFNLAT
jgi:hypothetical protein